MKDLKHAVIAGIIALLIPYALYGKDTKASRCIALLNGIELSLACLFFQPLFLLANPFLAIFALSPSWKKMIHATNKP